MTGVDEEKAKAITYWTTMAYLEGWMDYDPEHKESSFIGILENWLDSASRKTLVEQDCWHPESESEIIRDNLFRFGTQAMVAEAQNWLLARVIGKLQP